MRNSYLILAAFLVFGLFSCKEEGQQGPEKDNSTAALTAFLDSIFDAAVDRDPEWQSRLGLRKDYHRWTDISDARKEAEIDIRSREVAAMKARFDRDKLPPGSKILGPAVIIEAIFGVVEPERTEELRSLFMRWADGSLNSTMFILASLFTNSRLRRVLEGAVERRRRGPRPWPSLFFWQRLAELKLEIHAQLQREIDACRQGGTEGRDDVLAMLVDSRYEDGSAMSNAQILDELVTMLVAGYETTATSLCWLFELLFAHPPVLERLREELSAACEGGFDPVEASAVPYLGACIREALRLRPIAPVITRTLTRPLDLDPYHFEAGDTVWANMIATQRRPDLWERPETFEPERWLTTPKRPSHHYFPWGGGRRRCIGMAFANYEMKVATARILMRATLRKVDPAVAEPAFRAAVIAPADGTRMILERPLE